MRCENERCEITWHSCCVSEQSWSDSITWLTLPDVAEAIGESVGRVRRLLDERALIALRVGGVLRVPADFLAEGRPLSSLRGTLILLGDVGFSDEEAVRWLFEPEESIGVAPLTALRAGRKSEVRRVAAALA